MADRQHIPRGRPTARLKPAAHAVASAARWPRWGQRSAAIESIAALIVVACVAVGCAGPASDGKSCTASAACASGLCYVNVCLSKDGDADDDGLANAVEHRIGSHPLRRDSDGDGKDDGDEVGPNVAEPDDQDGDGKPDVIESAATDTDLDCLVDELDADDGVPNDDAVELAHLACSKLGVCAGQQAKIRAVCHVGQGVLQCDYGDVAGFFVVEQCDGADNDCDGDTDEGFGWQGRGIGEPCDGEGACGPGIVECQDGQSVCSSGLDGSARSDKPESCNGLDDDCDGVTDEDFALSGVAVGAPCLGTGECGAGVVACGGRGGGAPVCSTDPGGVESGATDEVCNGLDDDCDGATDEGIALGGVPVSGPCVGVGTCGPGVVVCSKALLPICSSDPGGPNDGAAAETCNGLDDNCNGDTDEGFVWQDTPLGGPCSGIGGCSAGVVVCGKLGKATCSSMPDGPGGVLAAEQCNGVDDDCDGATDEGQSWQGLALGAACPGLGACGAGKVECGADAMATCSTLGGGTAAQASAELCNNVDDDCDGLTDEDASAIDAPTCVPAGICIGAVATPVCTAGTWGCSYPGVTGWQGPAETSCDGKDNDCDGVIDEGLDKVWGASPVVMQQGWPAPRFDAAVTAAAGSLWVAGGTVGTADLGSALSDELWRYDLKATAWTRIATDSSLARTGVALAYLPAGWAAKGARIWALGGVGSGSTGSGPPTAVDIASGSVTALMGGHLPAQRNGAAALLDVANGHLWLLGGAMSGAVQAQRFDANLGAWVSPAKLPQPSGAAGAATACLASNGTVWLRTAATLNGLGEGGPSLHALPLGATAWTAIDAPMFGGEVQGGTLICDAAKAEHWLLGGVSASGAPAGLRRFHVDSATWTSPAVDATPAIIGGVAAKVGADLIVAFGRDGNDVANEALWSTPKGVWNAGQDAPTVSLGAVLASYDGAGGGGLLRIGGVTPVPGAYLPAATWHFGNKQWSQQAWPASVSRRIRPLVARDPVGQRTLIWGGIAVDNKVNAAVLAGFGSAAQLPAAKGALYLADSGGGVQALEGAAAATLPMLRSGAATVFDDTGKVAVTWALGLNEEGGLLELWRIDAAKITSTKIDVVAPQNVHWQPGAALWRDPSLPILRLVHTNGQLEVWRHDLGSAGWVLEASDAAVPTSDLTRLGGGSATELLLMALPAVGGSPIGRRLLATKAGVTIAAGPAIVAAWGRAPVATWMPTIASAVMTEHVTNGLPRAGFTKWQHACK